MGKIVKRPANLDEEFANELMETAKCMKLDFTVVAGKTMCADDFYEGRSLWVFITWSYWYIYYNYVYTVH